MNHDERTEPEERKKPEVSHFNHCIWDDWWIRYGYGSMGDAISIIRFDSWNNIRWWIWVFLPFANQIQLQLWMSAHKTYHLPFCSVGRFCFKIISVSRRFWGKCQWKYMCRTHQSPDISNRINMDERENHEALPFLAKNGNNVNRINRLGILIEIENMS